MLGFVSMLMDMSSEMVHSLLPVFLVTVLGASALTVGLIEGVAEATALIVKVFSGTMSDYLRRRKLLAVVGYGLAAVSKPLFALAATSGMVLVARFCDRIGKGIRGAPRDALIADLTPQEVRGAAFGLRQALDTVGAFVGPLIAIGLMVLWSNDFRAVFWLAVIPAILSVVLLAYGVHEPEPSKTEERVNPIRWREIARLSRGYWSVVLVGAVFTLARFSEAFLVLRAQQAGVPIPWIPIVLVTMNIVYALSAYPFGKLSDSVNRAKLSALGLCVLIGADLILAHGQSLGVIFLGIALWGLHMGVTQGLLAALVADTAPPDLRGTAFGLFNLVSGLGMLLASVIAGLLWDRFGAAVTFYAGAAFSALALAAFLLRKSSPSGRVPDRA